jgi:hypothetical protein
MFWQRAPGEASQIRPSRFEETANAPHLECPKRDPRNVRFGWLFIFSQASRIGGAECKQERKQVDYRKTASMQFHFGSLSHEYWIFSKVD